MIHLISNKYFLITTAVFILATTAVIWLLFPSAINAYRGNKSESAALTEKLKISRAEGVVNEELVSNKDLIETLYASASTALPKTPSTDLLLLQLDGLSKSFGLNATITVPFSQASTSSQVTTLASPKNDTEVKPGSGSVGGNQPIITNSPDGTSTDFSLSGEWDYPTVLNLLARLITFIRWNNITNIDITKTAEKSSATISGRVFWEATDSPQFSGSVKELLDKSRKLFDSYQSYTTAPDITKEGSFGKSNPFLP